MTEQEGHTMTEHPKIVGPPPGTNGAGGSGEIPPEYVDDTVDLDVDHDVHIEPDEVH